MLPIDSPSARRHHDRAEVRDRVHSIATDHTRADCVLLVGESGIGRSTVWRGAVAAARAAGTRVLAATAAEAESTMSYVVLGDMLEPVVDQVMPGLPAPQWEALEFVLLRSTAAHRPPSVRLIAMALQNTFSRCAERSGLLIAIDDVQWADPESQAALAFALRRPGDTPVRALMTMRTSGPFDWHHDLPAASALRDVFRPDQWLPVSPLTPTEVRTLIKDRLGITFSRGDSELLCASTLGNPAWAVELAGAWAREQRRPGAPAPTPSSLHAMMIRRVGTLDPEVIDVLCVVSALGRPTPQAVVRALDGLVSEPARALDLAVAQGIVDTVEPGVVSARPLLSAAATQLVPPGRQRRLFRRLVEIAESPEAKAHYMARTIDEGTPEESRREAAAAFDEVVEHARNRGAIGHAARLAEQALRLTAPGAPDIDRRRIVTARLHADCANFDRALEVMEPVDLGALPIPLLEIALPTTAALRYLVSGPDDARALIKDAAARSDPDPRLRSLLHTLLADRFFGDFAHRREHARKALHYADLIDPEGFRTYQACLQLFEVQADAGDGLDECLLERARDLEDRLPDRPMPYSVDVYHARGLIITDDLYGAQRVLRDSLANARAVADDMRIAVLGMAMAEAQLLAGDAVAAAASLAESDEAAAWASGEPTHKALLRGRLLLADGDVDEVESMVKELAWANSPHRTRRMIAFHLLGMVAGYRGEHDQAIDLLGRARSAAEAFGHHDTGARYRVDTELGTELVLARRLDEAAGVGRSLLAAGDRGNRCTLRGIGHRILGLCAAAEDDNDTASDRLSAAVAEHEHSQFRPELGRSLLARARLDLGRREARRATEALKRAAAIFGAGGFGFWCGQTRSELERAAHMHDLPSLTAAERRVVQLVLAGASNRDAAESLHLGIRTVESHLAAAYRKLGIRSRRELRAVFGSGAP